MYCNFKYSPAFIGTSCRGYGSKIVEAARVDEITSVLSTESLYARAYDKIEGPIRIICKCVRLF